MSDAGTAAMTFDALLAYVRNALDERSVAVHDISVESGYDTLHKDPLLACPHPHCVTDRRLISELSSRLALEPRTGPT